MAKFRPGQKTDEFVVKNGKRVVIRTPSMKDLDDLLRFINEIAYEDTFVMTKNRKSRKEEKDWLKKTLDQIKNNEGILLVAEVDKKIVGDAGVFIKNKERSSHVGTIGITVSKNYRGLKIGKRLFSNIIKYGNKKFKILYLAVFANNKLALNMYKKFGFKEVGRLPKFIKHKGKYVDEIKMIKEL